MEFIFRILVLFIPFIVAGFITWYFIYDSKKKTGDPLLWGLLGGISSLLSVFPFGFGGFGINMLVLSIYFFVTKRKLPAFIWLGLFILPLILVIIFFIWAIIGLTLEM